MEIKVTYATLHTMQERCLGTSDKITGLINDLNSDLVPLSQHWTGDAQQAYHTDQQKWDSASQDLAQVLRQISNTLGEINAAYQKVENANTAMFRG